MNFREIGKCIVAVGESIMYFMILRALGLFLFNLIPLHGCTINNTVPLFMAVVFLSSFTYVGIWLILAKKQNAVFWKAFIAFNIVPGILGLASRFIL